MHLRMQPRPHRTLRQEHDDAKCDEKDHHPRPELMPVFELWLCRPHEKRRHIPCIIVDRRLSAVGVGDGTVEQRRWHGDLIPWEGDVVVHSRGEIEPGRRLAIPCEQGIDIVRTAWPRLDHHRKIRRQCATIGSPCCCIVRERRPETVRKTSRALKHLTLVIRPVGHLHLGGERCHCLRREFRAALLTQVSVGEEPHRMAVRANLLIDVISALKLSVVERSERPGEAPFLRIELRFVAYRPGGRLCVLCDGDAERTSESDYKAPNERKADWRYPCHATGSGARR